MSNHHGLTACESLYGNGLHDREPLNPSGEGTESEHTTTCGREDNVVKLDQKSLQPADHHYKSKPKRYHKHAIFLLALYVPLLVIPWVLTCIMWRRPLFAPSYINQAGFYPREMTKLRRWVTTINVFNSILGVVTVPILSALVAQAAAVQIETQKRAQSLHVNHLSALADRGWTSPFTIYKSWTWKEGGSKSCRRFICVAAGLILLGAIQQPLYQILTSLETITIISCYDTKYTQGSPSQKRSEACVEPDWRSKYMGRWYEEQKKIVGWEIEPAEMQDISHTSTLKVIVSGLPQVSRVDGQPHLWRDIDLLLADPSEKGKKLSLQNQTGSFVASLEQGTATGVLREHAMRLNSSITCERLERSQFPSSCSGPKPFTYAFKHDPSSASIQVCVPGEVGISPWTISRNRQDLTEELFLGVSLVYTDRDSATYDNYTLHCKASTTRGYFELPNSQNNYTWGRILDKWPSPEAMEENFNDILEDGEWGYWQPLGEFRVPKEADELVGPPDLECGQQLCQTSGPLAMSAISLFGPESFLHAEFQALWVNFNESGALSYDQHCSLVPFNNYIIEARNEYNDYCELTEDRQVVDGTIFRKKVESWIYDFEDKDFAEQALGAAMFLANQAVLTMRPWVPEWEAKDRFLGGRKIYTAPGTTAQKPQLTKTSLVVISSLILLQLLGLGVLAYFIYRRPAEMKVLDAMSVAQIVADIVVDNDDGDLSSQHDGPRPSDAAVADSASWTKTEDIRERVKALVSEHDDRSFSGVLRSTPHMPRRAYEAYQRSAERSMAQARATPSRYTS